MEIRKVFPQEPVSRVNSLDFFRDGEFLLSSADDGTIKVFNCLDGLEIKKINSKSQGTDNALFTHHSSGIVCSTMSKFNHSVQYISLHDNALLREYRGHTDRINSLALSPTGDLLLSASLDSTVRVWDLASPQCVGILNSTEGHHAVAIDPNAFVFATMSTGNIGRFYDLKKLHAGPFTTFTIPEQDPVTWAGLEFSNDGKFLLASTHQGLVFLLDAISGVVRHKFTVENKNKCRLGAGFSSDSKFVLLGTENAHIQIFSLPSLVDGVFEGAPSEVVHLKGHAGPVGQVRFNPEYNLLASACTVTALWQPAEES